MIQSDPYQVLNIKPKGRQIKFNSHKKEQNDGKHIWQSCSKTVAIYTKTSLNIS